jgi:hypothetical protein
MIKQNIRKTLKSSQTLTTKYKLNLKNSIRKRTATQM